MRDVIDCTIDVIDLTGDDDVPAPPTKRQKKGPTVKAEDVTGVSGAAQTWPLPQTGSRPRLKPGQLLTDQHAAINRTYHAAANGPGTASQRRNSGDPRPQATTYHTPEPPSLAAKATPAPATLAPATAAQTAKRPVPVPAAHTRPGAADAAAAAKSCPTIDIAIPGTQERHRRPVGPSCPGPSAQGQLLPLPAPMAATVRAQPAGHQRPASVEATTGGRAEAPSPPAAGWKAGGSRPSGAGVGAGGAGDAGGGSNRGPAGRHGAAAAAKRHETWRRLHAQDSELAAAAREAGGLDGLDRASSLRFLELVHRHNNTLVDITDGAQAARDATQHKALAGIALQATARLERLGQRTPRDLVSALCASFPAIDSGGGSGGGGINWKRLAGVAASLFRPARGAASVMLGPLDMQPKQRKAPAQRRKAESVAAVTRPEEYAAGENNCGALDASTLRIMQEMTERLRAVRSAATGSLVEMPSGLQLPEAAFRPLVEVILDHAGFAQTVENSHAVGYLMKQGDLLVCINDDDQMTLAALTSEESKAVKKAGQSGGVPRAGGSSQFSIGGRTASAFTASRATAAASVGLATDELQHPVHFIIPLDMADWREMCRLVPPHCCLLPSRVYGGGGGGGAAQGAPAAAAAPRGGRLRPSTGGSGAGPSNAGVAAGTHQYHRTGGR